MRVTNQASGGQQTFPSFSFWETMCTAVSELTSDDDYGKKFRRTLETKDEDHIKAAY